MTTTLATTKAMTTTMRTTTTTKTKQQQQATKKYQRYNNNNNNKNNNKQQQEQQELCQDCASLFFFGGGFAPLPPPFFWVWHLRRHFCLKDQKVIIFPLQVCPPSNIAFLEKNGCHPFFSGNAMKIGVFENFEKPDFFEKNGGTTSCPFSRPPKKWVLPFFFAFFFLPFFCFFCI